MGKSYLFIFLILHVSGWVSAQLKWQQAEVHMFDISGGNIQNPHRYYRDQKGYFWLLGHGLERFDGHHLKSYKKKGIGNLFYQAVEDNSNRLFFIANSGIYILNKKTDKIELFQDSVTIEGKKKPVSTITLRNTRGDLWFACGEFIARLPNGSNQIEDMTSKLSLPYDGLYNRITIDKDDNIYCSSSKHGLIRINSLTLEVTSKKSNKENESIFDHIAEDAYIIYNKKDKNYWAIKYTNGIFLSKFDVKTKIWKKYDLPFPGNAVLDKRTGTWPDIIFLDHNSELWVTLGEGLGFAKYNQASDKLDFLYTNDLAIPGKRGNHMSIGAPSPFLYQDHHHNFWFFNVKLICFTFDEALIKTLSHDHYWPELNNPSLLHTTKKPITSAVKLPKERYLIHIKELDVRMIDKDWNASNINLPFSDEKNPVRKIFNIEKSDDLFVLLQDGSYYRYNIDTRKIIYKNQDDILPKYQISDHRVKDQTLYLFFRGYGIAIIDWESGKIDKHIVISGLDERCFYPENDHEIWLGLYKKGAIKYNFTTQQILDTFTHIHPYIENEYNFYADIMPFGDNKFLLAGYGITIFDKSNKKYERLDESNGLRDPQLSTFGKVRNDKVIAFTTEEGVAIVDINRRKIRHLFNKEDDVYKNGSNHYYEGGKYDIFTSIDGGSYFIDTTFYYDDKIELSTEITDLIISGNSIPFTKDLKLPENTRNIEIHFANLKEKMFFKTIYEAFLEGYDQTWQKIQTPTLIYQDLPAGNYNLKVRSISQNGNEVQTDLLSITIVPPFYKRIWFLAPLFAGIMYLVYFLINFRYNQKISMKNQQLQIQTLNQQNTESKYQLEVLNTQLAEAKLHAIQAQMNPHFIFNSLNSIENFIMKNDKVQASNYLNKFAKLIRSVLENTKQGEILLRNDIESLKLYTELEQLRFNNKFNVQFEIDESLFQSNYLIPAFLLQPFVENAILHGINHSSKEKCLLLIYFKEKENFISVIILDDGIGIEASKKLNTNRIHKSDGMTIAVNKLKHFNQNAFIDDIKINPFINDVNMSTGTKVELKIVKKVLK